METLQVVIEGLNCLCTNCKGPKGGVEYEEIVVLCQMVPTDRRGYVWGWPMK